MKFIALIVLGLILPISASAQDYVMTSKASIEDYIMSRAIAYNYRPDRAASIAKAESGFNVNAKNASSTASGLFQFVNGTFKYYCMEKYRLTNTMLDKNDPMVQVECAVKMLSEGGESHWNASKSIWGK